MKMHDLTDSLHKHPFLKNMDQDLVATLTSCASNVKLPGGKYLFHEGEDAKTFYLVRSGKVALEAGGSEQGQIRIQTLGPGEVLGWSWLIAPYRWHFDAYAVEQVQAFAIDAACLRAKSETDWRLGYEMLRRFSEVLERRLEATRHQLIDIYETSKGEKH